MNVGVKLSEQITDNYNVSSCADSNQYKTYCTGLKPELLVFPNTYLNELLMLVRHFKVNKASNIEGINISLFKDCMLANLPQIMYLFNLIFVRCYIPVGWKKH